MKRYTWRDWWKAHDGMSLFRISAQYSDIYGPLDPRRYKPGGKLYELWYYFKCLLFKRYSTVTPRDIPPTWIDRGDLLLHTSFQLLCDFVEKEQDWNTESLEAIASDKTATEDIVEWTRYALPDYQEIAALYHWWTVTRAERHAEHDRRLTVWHDLFTAHRQAYTDSFPDWQKTDRPGISRWSLPAEVEDPEPLVVARQLLDELGEDVLDKEDDDMLHRLINIRHRLWT